MKIDTDSIVLGVDLDDCVIQYQRGLAALVEEKKGIDKLPPAESWDFCNWPLEEGEFLKFHSELIRSGGFQTLEPMPGAVEILQRLSDEDYYIRIITHRLVLKGHHRQVVTDTVDWLDNHKVPYKDICFAADKATVGADIYVDDAPHNHDAIVRAGKPCILYDRPYNRGVDAELRAYSWNDAYDLIHREMESE